MAGVAVGTVGVLFGSAGAAVAAGLDTYPDEQTEAEASFVEAVLGGSEIAGLGASEAGSDSNPGPNSQPLSGEIAGTDLFDLGNGVTIPLDQLIQFGQLGALASTSTATDGQNGEALSGIAGADGAAALDGQNGDFGTASIDLLSLFNALGVDTITDQAIDQADFNFGLGGAWVQAVDGEFKDPDAVGGLGQYRIGDMSLDLHSPAIETAADGLSDAAGQIEDAVLGVINDALGLTELLSAVPGVEVNVSIDSDLQQDVLDAVLLAPIVTDDGLASLNLGDGMLSIDLGRIGGNDDGARDEEGPIGLNNQNPNTELIDGDTYPFIASSVHDVIERVIDVAYDAALESLQSAQFTIEITEPTGTSAGITTNLAGEVSDQYCEGGLTEPVTCGIINPVLAQVSGLMTDVVAPILNADPNPIYEVLETIKTDMVTAPIRAAIDPFLEILADNLISLQINHQETQTCMLNGTEVPSGLEVSALSLGVLDGTARLNVGNAGLRVDACDTAAATPNLEASSPAPAGGETEITSGGWAPDTDVTLQLTDADGNPVGDPITVTTDGDGNVPTGTMLPIPADVTPGDLTVVAEDPDGNAAQGPLAVYNPELEAETPAQPGQCTVITSGGWLPETDVTLQLTDADGNAVGDPVVVTTDADGNLPADTCVTIPEDAAPGDYDIIGTDDNGAEETAPVEVVEDGAIVPSLEASSPAPAGGETEITSGGWAPDTDVTLQLTDADGNPVGDPITVTTDGDGNVPAGAMLPIPADVTPGDLTVVAEDPDGNAANDTIEVYAPQIEAETPVAPGECSAITSGGWMSGSEVTLQLVDADGNPVGEPVVVTADENGNLPEGTCVGIPEGADEGDYEIIGIDDNGAEESTPVEVGDGGPSVEVAPNVPAGTCAEIASSGWAPNSTVTFQLVNADGEVVNEVTFETDADGNVVAADGQVCIDIPDGLEPGDYTIGGEDENGNSGEDTTAVYTPEIQAETPVAPGGDTEVVSSGWLPDSEVTLTLVDADGNAAGEPVVVTTDGDGNVPAGTTVAIPGDVEPGDFTVVGTDENGGSAEAAIEVTATGADGPRIEATSPVPAGGETTVTSDGWAPNTEVMLELTDPSGESIGDVTIVTTDAEGVIPGDTVLAVPGDAVAGDYTVMGTDTDGTSVDTTVVVYAPSLDATSPVPAGGMTLVTSGGWLPETDVTLELTGVDGNTIGDAVTVTTDADGNVPADTALTVPVDTVEGTALTVTGVDVNGASAADDVEVVASGALVLDASSPVLVGESTTVWSSGWAAGVDVTLALTDADGNAVGDVMTVTTDGSGNLPVGTALAIPGDAERGIYTVTGTDAEGATVSDDIEAYDPSIEADSPVDAGTETAVTSGGWAAESVVTLELLDVDGNAVGDAVTVTTDANGTIPVGTTVPVPGDEGSFSLVATDDHGASVDAPVEVVPGAGNGGGDDDGDGNAGGDSDGDGNGDGLAPTGGDFAAGGMALALLTLLVGTALVARARMKSGVTSE